MRDDDEKPAITVKKGHDLRILRKHNSTAPVKFTTVTGRMSCLGLNHMFNTPSSTDALPAFVFALEDSKVRVENGYSEVWPTTSASELARFAAYSN